MMIDDKSNSDLHIPIDYQEDKIVQNSTKAQKSTGTLESVIMTFVSYQSAFHTYTEKFYFKNFYYYYIKK
jgi:hypothetical protein